MKKTCLVSTMFLLMLNSTAWGTIIHGYHNEQLTIETGLPPAVLVVEDSAGRRTGADRTKPFDQDGWQVGPDGTEYSAGLQEIPNSDIEEQNVANEENPTGLNYSNPSTGWEVHIKDGGKQTYTINLYGVTTDRVHVGISGLIRHQPYGTIPFQAMEFFITPMETKKLIINYDPIAKTITTQRVVENNGLFNDIKAACQLNQITSTHVCKHFEDQAEAIQDALDHHHYEEAERLIWVFLHSLGESRPEGCKDDDDHSAVQETALTILKEDAKALLVQVEKDEKAGHGDHDHAGDNTH